MRVLVLFCAQLMLVAAAAPTSLYLDPNQPDDARVWDIIGRLTTSEKIELLTADVSVVSRLGGTQYSGAVMSMRGNECLHGVDNVGGKPNYNPDRNATMFPQAIGLAATWNRTLLRLAGTVIANESRALRNLHRRANDTSTEFKSYLTCWSPVVNIARDIRWGRVPETYGECPTLTKLLGAQMVQGMQGDHPRYLKVAAAPKHFTVYDGPEEGRFTVDAAVPSEDLQATWLEHWRYLVQHSGTHPLSGVMGSYSAVDGVPMCANRRLLTDTLRTEYGFQGWVVSDCGAVTNIMKTHHFVNTTAEACAAAINAGLDIFCDDAAIAAIPEALQKQLLRESQLDTSLYRIFLQQIKLGHYDPIDMNPYDAIGERELDSNENKQLAREAAAQSVVLLGNTAGLLPLSASQHKNIAVIGPSANEPFDRHKDCGNGKSCHPFYLHIYAGVPSSISSPLAAFQAKPNLNVSFAQGCDRHSADTSGIAAAVAAAKAADVAVLFVGLDAQYEEEGVDRVHPSNNPFALPGVQQALVDAVVATGVPTVQVLMNGGPLALKEPAGGALVEAWYGGQAAGLGLVDVLFGDVAPAGKMPLTVYDSVASVGDIHDFDMSKGRTYRYLPASSEPLYPFGFGLSYSRFSFGGLFVPAAHVDEASAVTVAVNITNVGTVDSAEVVQLYLSLTVDFASRTNVSTHVPARQLLGFSKVFLKVGERHEVRFEFVPKDCTGWGFFREELTQVYLAVGGVSPTHKTLNDGSLALTQLTVMRTGGPALVRFV